MYDYYLGGKDNFASDREAAEKVLALVPGVRDIVRDNREFLGKAVRALAQSGVRQFIDIGAGLPTKENVHQVALGTVPDARIVYVDNDPIVLAHARALLADNPHTIVVKGDIRAARAILDDPAVRAHIDFDEPFAIILCAILHFIPDDEEASRVVAELRSALVPGGALLISHGYTGEGDGDATNAEVQKIYARTSETPTPRDRAAISAYFAGLELLEPGLVHVEMWRPDRDIQVDPASPGGLGAVGVVPRQ
jgi:SAM-dependent methyltransferase